MMETAQPEAVFSAHQPDTGAPEGAVAQTDANGEDTFLTVRYNKEELPLTKEAAAVYAQKGLNYDKINDRLEKAREKLEAFEGVGTLAKEFAQQSGLTEKEALNAIRQRLDDERDKQSAVNMQLDAFLKAYPDVDPRTLPASVMEAWRAGTPLVSAYADMLETQMQAQQTNARNASASMGGATGIGAAAPRPMTHDAIKTMSSAELAHNHSRIWAYLTGQKE